MALAAGGFAANWLRLPVPVGFLAAGILLSPHTVGAAYLPAASLELVKELGILILLFVIGLELDLPRLRSALRATARVLPFDLAVPAVVVAGLARLAGWTFQEAAALGIAVAMSSTLFGERMTQGPAVDADARKRVLGVLIAEDLAAGLLLALLVLVAVPEGAGGGFLAPALQVGELLFWLLVLAAAALLLIPRVLDEVARHHQHELMVLWSLGLLVLWGYLGHIAGSAELGALLAGVAAAEAGSQYVVRNSLVGVRDVALAVFFFASGVVVDVAALAPHILWVAGVAAAFLVAKLLVHAPAAWFAGLPTRGALQTGFALGTVGEFSLILVAVAERQGIAHPLLQNTVVGAMVLLLLVAGLLMAKADPITRRLERTPAPIRRPLRILAKAMRRTPGQVSPRREGFRRHVRVLASNAVLLALWSLAGVWLERTARPALADEPVWLLALVGGLYLAGAAVLVWGTYRGYRAMIWDLVGPRRGEPEGAARVRVRIMDTLVVAGLLVLAVAMSLRTQQTLTVVLGSLVVAGVVGSLAWRQLQGFHQTLQETVTRVLGEDVGSGAVLDKVVQQYPWGVRFAAVAVPSRSPLVGQTIQESRLGELTGAMVAVMQRRGRETVTPPPDTIIQPGDTLVLMGDLHQLERGEALLVAHGDALRLTARSQTAHLEEVTIDPASPWAGRMLAELDIKGKTGTLVVGIWPDAAEHPTPFEPEQVLRPGDRLILLGGPLQVQRARALAGPQDGGDGPAAGDAPTAA